MPDINDVPEDRRCNAKTRAGTPCRKWGILPSGRCRNHGGKSFRGIASPRYTYGHRSKDLLARLAGEYRAWREVHGDDTP